jgi:transposase-like protein
MVPRTHINGRRAYRNCLESLRLGGLRRPERSAAVQARARDGAVARVRSPLRLAEHTFVWVDARVVKVREVGRAVDVHALIRVGSVPRGQREILGLDVARR